MARKESYIVHSKTKRPHNPARCWHNIAPDKLHAAAAANADYYFQYIIDGKVYQYSYPARELLEIFQRKNVRIKTNWQGKKWDFFGEYQTGRLFRNVSSSDTEILVQLHCND